MELSARQLERTWAEDAAKRAEQEALQNQKTLLIKNQQAEELAFKTLIADALHWKELKLLDEYLAGLAAKQTHTPAFLEWLAWAKQKRISEDPSINFSIVSKDQ